MYIYGFSCHDITETVLMQTATMHLLKHVQLVSESWLEVNDQKMLNMQVTMKEYAVKTGAHLREHHCLRGSRQWMRHQQACSRFLASAHHPVCAEIGRMMSEGGESARSLLIQVCLNTKSINWSHSRSSTHS